MNDAAISDPACFIHQIVPRSFHELVAKLRQETARADILGETGHPIIVIGVRFGLVRRGGSFGALLPLGFVVEGQMSAEWTANDLHQHVRGTPAEGVLATILRMAVSGAVLLDGWVPPLDFGMDGWTGAVLTVLGSVAVILPDSQDGTGETLVCLQYPRTDIEGLELPLRAASDFRRFRTLWPEAAPEHAELSFAHLDAVEAAEA